MKTVKRILLITLITIIVVAAGGYFFLWNIKHAAIPDYNKNVNFKGLLAEVNVLRDQFAIPHISASNESDLYKSVGFTMAQDRLWQMDLLRRVTQGRLSEIFDSSTIMTDLLMRALRIEEKSEKILHASDPKIIKALEDFAEGINFYIAHYPLPPEFKVLGYKPDPWKPVHSINLIGYMSWDLRSGWDTKTLLYQLAKVLPENQIRELVPDLKNHKTAIFPDFGMPILNSKDLILSANAKLEEMGLEVFNGSNNWAVSAKKSKTGKPILANDMHLSLFAPGIWYQMHQSVKGGLNVTGLVLPGQPFVIAGHNDSIAWGMTNVMVDDIDFYLETFNPGNTKYLLNGEWKDLLVKPETINIKGGSKKEKTLLFTHRGPVINDFNSTGQKPVSMRWIGNEMSDEIRTVYKLNRASNWTDFRDAVKTFISVSQNVIFADVAGNIGLQTSAGIAIRKGDGFRIYPGDSTEYDWQGLVPFDQLPFEYNPDRGYVSSANNKTVPGNYPYYVSLWFATPDRIDRIREMIDEKDKLGIEDFEAMQNDVHSKLAERMMPHFLPAIKKQAGWNQTEKVAGDIFSSWDGNLTRESKAATIFEILYRKTMENLVKDDLPEKLYNQLKGDKTLLENLMLNILPDKTSAWIDDKTTPEKETFDDIVIRSFKETVSELDSTRGSDPGKWSWGKIHTFRIDHPLGSVPVLAKALNLNKGPFEMPGSYHTVCPYSYSFQNLYKVNHGASHRHIFDLSNWDASKTVIPTGESGIPASDFYCDQTKLYINNAYHDDPFSPEKIKDKTRFSMKFIP